MKTSFTIGVPVYNGMPYLKETIESLITQSYPDFRILVINDGSKDASAEYLASLRDPRLRIVHQENQGLTATLNRMLQEIDTPWLVRQDADDISLPDRMVYLRRAIDQFPDAGMVYSKAVHYQDGRQLMQLQTTVAPPQGLRSLTQAGHLLSICHSSIALCRRKLLDLGGYRFNLHVEDYDMYWRMALAHDIHFIPETLVAARTGSRGISGTNIERQALNVLWVQYLLMSHLKQQPPRSYDQVQQQLRLLMTSNLISYRLNMRKCLDAIGERRFLSAARYTVRAAASSPPTFLRRLVRMVSGSEEFVLGLDPKLFDAHEALLWPAHPQVDGTTQSNTSLH